MPDHLKGERTMIIAFTGAGISRASGIPTFDEQGDLRTKLDRCFATYHRKEFNKIMQQLADTCKAAEPNDAHKALAEYNIPVITMNIDGLHNRAGSQYVIEVHGNAEKNNVVLYGDAAPKYTEALDIVDRMCKDDILLIVGTSFYTSISSQIKYTAENNQTKVVIINDDAEHQVRKFLEENQSSIGNYEDFMKRRPSWHYNFHPYDYD